MAKQTSKNRLLKDIQTERRRLENILSTLSDEDMKQPGTIGTWSVKDTLAHLVAWEQLLLNWFESGLQGNSPTERPVGMSRKRIDMLNRVIYEKNKNRPLEDVLAEFHASYERVLNAVEAMSEDDLFTRGRFGWIGPLTLADYVAGNTCNHYAWAKAQIRKQFKHKVA